MSVTNNRVMTDIGGEGLPYAETGQLWNVPGQVVNLGNMTHNGGLEYDPDFQATWNLKRGGDEFVVRTEGDDQFMVARSHLIDIEETVRRGELQAKYIEAYDPNLTIGQPWGVTLENEWPRHLRAISSLSLAYNTRTTDKEGLVKDPTFTDIKKRLGSIGIAFDELNLNLYQTLRKQGRL